MTRSGEVRFALINGPCQFEPSGPKCANNGSFALIRSTLVATVITWLLWSFGQPGLPQSFFVSKDIFGAPKRAQHVFKSGNT